MDGQTQLTQEVENPSDDGQWWQMIADILEGARESTWTGEQVVFMLALLLIVAGVVPLYKLAMAWLNRGKRGNE